jgi:glycosyltransferase involved in cell wall biosynthesis
MHDKRGNVEQSYIHSHEGVIVHIPNIGTTLPVFVWDKYPSFEKVIEFTKIDRNSVDTYINRYVNSFLGSGKFDVIHANHAIMMPVVARKINEQMDTPYVISLHGSALVYAVEKRPACFKYAIQGLEKAERVLVGNQYFKSLVLDFFIGSIPDIASKIVEVPLGVDTDTFTPRPREQHQEALKLMLKQNTEQFLGRNTKQNKTINQMFLQWKENHEIPSEVLEFTNQYSQKHPDANLATKLSNIDWKIPTVMYVGRLILGKGVHDLLISFCELVEHQDIQLLIIGAGPIREWLEGYVWIRKHGLDSMIKSWIDAASTYLEGEQLLETVSSWLMNRKRKWHPLPQLNVVFTGFMDHSLLRYILPCADIAVFPSLIPESFGLVALEAAAAGVIPLVTDFSGLRDSAQKFENQIPEVEEGSLRFPLESEERLEILSKKIEEALVLARRGSIHEKIHDVCEKLYSWKAVTKLLVQVYESVQRTR